MICRESSIFEGLAFCNGCSGQDQSDCKTGLEKSQSPFPGKLYSKSDPFGPGVDVYEGCNIDYKSVDVTPQKFMDARSSSCFQHLEELRACLACEVRRMCSDEGGHHGVQQWNHHAGWCDCLPSIL